MKRVSIIHPTKRDGGIMACFLNENQRTYFNLGDAIPF
jgi:hypothetical protein